MRSSSWYIEIVLCTFEYSIVLRLREGYKNNQVTSACPLSSTFVIYSIVWVYISLLGIVTWKKKKYNFHALHAREMDQLAKRRMYIKNVVTVACFKYAALRNATWQWEEQSKCLALKKRMWACNWIVRCESLGGEVLLQKLSIEDPKSYTNTLRMSSDQFNELLGIIETYIQCKNRKLKITLRYLATGDSFKSFSLLFHVPHSSISTFLPEVLRAISTALSSYIKVRRHHSLLISGTYRL